MKKLANLLLILLIGNLATAQVKFERLSFEEACKQAGISGKIVFAQFVSANCEQCNEVAEKAFTDKELGKIVKEKCIAIKIDVDNIDRSSFIEKYNPNESMGTAFLTGDGDLLYRMVRTSTNASSYIEEIENAYSRFTEGRLPLKELDGLWNLSTNDFAAMEMNLRRRFELSLAVDSLLDVYVSRLPDDSASSKRVLTFIMKLSPIINSVAFKMLRKNSVVYTQLWNSMPPKDRKNIDKWVAYKSRKWAVKHKDYSMALNAASFASAIPLPSSEGARMSYTYQLMAYHKEINDTANAFPQIVEYIDGFFMRLSIDTIKQRDIMLTKKQFDKVKTDTVWNSRTAYTVTKMVKPSIMAQAYLPLNDAALYIYKNTLNPYYLAKALAYAERCVMIFETPEVIDTYAKLLYQTGKVSEAIQWEEKAIKILTKRAFTAERFKMVLQKMKDGADVKKLQY